jgi:hypothetical protein
MPLPPTPPPFPLFPPAPSVSLITNTALQNALNAACASVTIGGKTPNFGLTIVDLAASPAAPGNFASAIWNPNTEHYSASMLKAACIYAAFTLLDLAQRFARARAPKNPAALFALFVSDLDPLINTCCPMITGKAPKVRLPRWTDVFTATGTGAGMSVQFTPSFAHSIEMMIVPSDNTQAGRCIRGVGYAYLNGLMMVHQFFDPIGQLGVWLAGDYSGSDVVTIPYSNDVVTKQGATSEEMARLGAVILTGSVLPAASHGAMADLLKKSAHGSDSSWFSRSSTNNNLNGTQVTHGKIGLGPLKSNRNVYSDLNAISDPVGRGGRFIVCYSNVDYNPYAIDHVLWVFLTAMATYQSAAFSAGAAGATGAAPSATVTP